MVQISNSICQFERKYAVLKKNICHFWDHGRACFPEKISKAQKHIHMMHRCTPNFSRKRRLVKVPRIGFFQDSPMRVYDRNSGLKSFLQWIPRLLRWSVGVSKNVVDDSELRLLLASQLSVLCAFSCSKSFQNSFFKKIFKK